MDSKLGKLNLKELAKSVTMFFVTTLVTSVVASAQSGSIPTDIQSWKSIAGTAGIAAVSYIGSKLMRNSKGELLKKEVNLNHNAK